MCVHVHVGVYNLCVILPSVGIEPTTLGLLDPRSNQLSYEGKSYLTYNLSHNNMCSIIHKFDFILQYHLNNVITYKHYSNNSHHIWKEHRTIYLHYKLCRSFVSSFSC